jgi:hypothetical protein
MSASDFAPLFDAIGTEVSYTTRSFGAASADTGWEPVTWSSATTVKVIMYPLSKRNEGTPDTRGVTEQRWYVISQTKLAKDNRIQRGTEYYIIDTEAATLQVLGEVLVYECEAIREMLYT